MRKRSTVAVIVALGCIGLGGVALATPGLGVLAAPVHARGILGPNDGPNVVVNSKSGVHLKAQGPVGVVTQQVLLAPGGHTGWHSHPGPVIVTVKAGSLRLIYADDLTCQGTVYRAGDTFVDRGDEVVHIARADPAAGVELWATYFIPGDPAAGFRIDAPDPGTGC
jgi:quercetin dioxygenase-like cupin family protein